MQSVRENRKRKRNESLFEFQDLSYIEYLDQWKMFKNIDGIDLVELMKLHGNKFQNVEEFEVFFSLIKFHGLRFNDLYTYNNRRITILNEYMNFHCIHEYLKNQLSMTQTDLFTI